MAQRVGVDTSSLRGMNKGLRVVARPVDTYSSVGNQVDRNSKGLQVANALASFEPKLSEFFDGQIQKRNKTDLAEGMRQYLDADPDARENFRKAIKSGEIDLVQSPFFIKGLTSGILKEKSREFGSKMVEEWSQRKDNAGFDVSDFIAQSQDLFITENGLADYDPELFAAEFAPRAENYANIVGQRHYEHKIKRAKQARLDLIPSDMIAAYESNLSEQGELQPKGYIKSVNKVIEGVIKDGLNPAAAIAGAVDHLTALAMSDETIADTQLYQDALRDLKVKGGTYGQTGKGSLYLQQLDDKVDTKIERLEREKDTEVEDKERDQAKTFYQEFVKMHNSYKGKDFFNDAVVSAELENAHQNPYFAPYYNQLKIIDQDRRLVTTDTDTFNQLSQKAEKGTLTSQDVLDSSHLLSSQHFNSLNAATDTVNRAGSLASVLGADFVAQFVSDVTRVEEPTKLQQLMMTATGRSAYDQLAADAQFSANSVLMELLGDKTYSDGLGSREGNLAFKNELLKRLEAEQTKKGGFNDRRDAISNKASEAQATADKIEIEVERTTQLTDQGMSDVQIQDTSHIPVLPPEQASLEVSRPPNKLSYDVTWKEGDITPFSDMSIEEIHKIMNEYTSVKTGEGGTLQSWETSKAWVMMQEMGLNETELAALFSEHIRVKGPIEEAERIEKLKAEAQRQQKELSGPALSDEDQAVVDENELDAIEMHGEDKVAQYKLDYPETYLAKLMQETMQPDFVAFEAEPFEPAETDTTTLLETVSEAVAPYISGTDDTGEAMFEASGGQFFDDGEGSLTEQAVGAAAKAATDLVSGTGDRYDNEAMFEASDGQFFDKGTVELPPSIQGGLLSQEDYDAMSVDAQQRADEKATAIQAEAIGNVGSPRDRIGDINTAIVDLGEGFLKAVARSFEATGKAGAERTRELQRFARQAALYKELLNNPNVEAQELTRKINLATSENIGIGNVDNSKRMAELLELRDPDKALAAAQKFLSPEAKIRIDNASALFGDASAADAALMLAQPYLSEEAKQRIAAGPIMTERPEPQPPVDLRGRSSPTAQTAAQEIDTTGTVKLGSTPTETGKQVFKLRSVLEQNGKVPKLSDMKNAVRGEKAKKLVVRSWQDAFGKHYRVNGTAKPAFMRQALDIAKQTETNVTTVIKAVLGTNPSANKLLVTSGLTTIEAQQLHTKYQEIRKLFEQMNKDT